MIAADVSEVVSVPAKNSPAAPRVLVAVRLPVELARRLKVEAARRRTSVQAIVETAVRKAVAR